MLIFSRGPDSAFDTHEQTAGLYGMEDATNGEYLFLNAITCFFETALEKLTNVRTDGGRNLSGSKTSSRTNLLRSYWPYFQHVTSSFDITV